MLWRHGDVLIASIEKIPEGAIRRPTNVLVRGEMTGHSHRIEQAETAVTFEHNGQLFLKVTASEAKLIHEEHKTITLPYGVYRVWQQREYIPGSIRKVID
ncbi:MAG: hypothetical protein AB1489_17410 [Acidobacteriota bacterium]